MIDPISLASMAAWGRTHWRLIAAGCVAIGAAIAIGILAVRLDSARDQARDWQNRYRIEHANHRISVANYRLAAARAEAEDLAHARAVERRDATIAQETEHDLRTKLDAARRDAAAYAERLRAARVGADQGGVSAAHLPGAAAAAGDAARAGQGAELDDAVACAEGVIKAQGWQDWWAEVSAAKR